MKLFPPPSFYVTQIRYLLLRYINYLDFFFFFLFFSLFYLFSFFKILIKIYIYINISNVIAAILLISVE